MSVAERGHLPIIDLRKVTKSYQRGEVEIPALKETSLQVFPGEFVVLLGPSGCGKTTLINLIGGLDTPTSGEVFINSKSLAHMDDEALTAFRRDDVGFIFQFFNLVNTLTARENILLAAELSAQPLDADDVLASVGLAGREHHFPSELSGGEQQRVAIARALVKHAPLLLCDEPTGELDFETGRMIIDLLHRTTHERDQTVMMVTHNAAIGTIADRVLRLRSGSILSDEHNDEPLSPMELSW